MTTDFLSSVYFGSPPYLGPQPGVLAPNAEFDLVIPSVFNGKITTGSGDTSFTEFSISDSQTLYDINNSLGKLTLGFEPDNLLISFSLGFTVGQRIQVGEPGCLELRCDDATCPCEEAIRTYFFLIQGPTDCLPYIKPHRCLWRMRRRWDAILQYRGNYVHDHLLSLNL